MSAPQKKRKAPKEPKEKFALRARGFHLTYRSFLDYQVLFQFVRNLFKEHLVYWSLVHEEGHGDRGRSVDAGDGEDRVGASEATRTVGQIRGRGSDLEEGDEPFETEEVSLEEETYKHTHAAFWFSDRVRITRANAFDFTGIHPHVQPVNKAVHFSRLYFEYHRKQPVQLWQSKEAPPAVACAADGGGEFATIKRAKTLGEACSKLGIAPKSITDVIAIRNERTRPEPEAHVYGPSSFRLALDGSTPCIYIYGPSGTGKTEWAVHSLERPLLCRAVDDVREFDPEVHGGIVFDEFSPIGWTGEQVILAFEHDRATTIRCRYRDGKIPAGTRRIFTSNIPFEENILGRVHPAQQAAVRRRVTVIRVHGNVFARQLRERDEGGDGSHSERIVEGGGVTATPQEEVCDE